MTKSIAVAIAFLLLPGVLFSQPPSSFSIAKREAKALFTDQRQTLYCNCRYGKNHQVDLKSCHMELAKSKKRARRVEFEHMMPAENFGRQFKCWREKICTNKKGKKYKGRRCCRKINAIFRKAEGELYNLWPAVGLVNQTRSNYRFGLLEGKADYYGCLIKIDKKRRKVEPPNFAKGIAARANLFMADKYNIRLSSSQRKLFQAWDKHYPPTPQ